MLDLLTGPKNGAFGRCAEPFWIVDRSIIVVPYDAYGHLHDEVQTLSWVGTVPDDIAQADDSVDFLRFNVLEHRLEGFEIAMDIA